MMYVENIKKYIIVEKHRNHSSKKIIAQSKCFSTDHLSLWFVFCILCQYMNLAPHHKMYDE